MAFGFFNIFGRAFKAIFRAFGGVFRSEMAKFVTKYEATFKQIILDVAAGTLEGDRNKQAEAFARLITALKGVPEAFRTHWVNWGIETVYAKLAAKNKV